MIEIRPVSDLRNKYPEIEELVLKEDQAVYLTKNGYGSMVVMSIEKYSNLIQEIEVEKALNTNFGNCDIEKLIDESEEKIKGPNTKYLQHDELFSKIKEIVDEK